MASLYDRFVLPAVITAACGAPAIMTERAALVPLATGRVLEVGVGAGLNLRYYDPRRVDSVEAIDPSAELLARAAVARRPGSLSVELLRAVAEDLPFEGGRFDTVVLTFTLCSVQRPARALAEVRRVLRPGGRLLFCEHGASPDPSVARWQRRLEPAWRRLAGGCHLTRPVGQLLGAAGFAVDTVRNGYIPGAPRLAGWCERGAARSA